MSDTRALLDRITSFRERLQQEAVDPNALAPKALAENGPALSQSLRTLAGDVATESAFPKTLTMRTRQLLEEARELVTTQREVSANPFLREADEPTALAKHHRETVALTESALRLVQAYPDSASAQVRLNDGLRAMLTAIRDRLAISRNALAIKTKQHDRIDQLARRLSDLSAGRVVNLNWFVELSDALLEEARQAEPLRILNVEPLSTSAHADSPVLPVPARFIACHALNVAQVVARVVTQDYEWAGRPNIPVLVALLMDVGMMKVPASVLAKTTPLTPEERRQIEEHAAIGAKWVSNHLSDAGVIAEAIRQHHERADGSGYPEGLQGETITTLARLVSVCDYYTTQLQDRPHRMAIDPRSALTNTLLAAEQGRFEQDFAEYLVALSFYPVGTIVELNDGRIAVVAAQHPRTPNLRSTSRPVVALLTEPNGSWLPRPDFVDLAAADHGAIVHVLTSQERANRLAEKYPDLCD